MPIFQQLGIETVMRILALILLPVAAFGANDTRLAEAAMEGNKAAVRSLLQQEADVNAPLVDGTTALHWVVRADDLETAKALIRAGANVKTADRYGITPLSLACSNGSAPMIRELLNAGADPNSADPRGDTVLMAAARLGDVEALKTLLDRGASVNAKDSPLEQTALMWAVRENHSAAVQLLLEHGAEVNARTRTGTAPARRPPGAGGGSHGVGIVRSGWPDQGFQDATPGAMTSLLYAARDGRIEAAQMLVAAKADVNQSEANGVSPLLIAVANNHLDVAKFLLEHGADPNRSDFWGRAPLWEAVELRNLDLDKSGENGIDRPAMLDLIQLILRHGADLNARIKEVPPVRRWIMPLGDLSWVDFTGQTPFLRAALSGDITVMRLLLAHGADPNIATFAGTTALMAAAGVNWVGGQTYTESKGALMEAVKLCLEKGANVNDANSMGITAVIGAANRGSDDIIEFLAQKGAKLDAKDKEGRTPLVWAQGVFLATNSPAEKPNTIALLKKLTAKSQ
jgi:ankyrin repeat protein